MFGKYYSNILDKIKILKNAEDSPILENFEQKFNLECAKYYDKSETDFNAAILSSHMINELNNIAQNYSPKIQEEFFKIPIKSKQEIKEIFCKNCNIVLKIRN